MKTTKINSGPKPVFALKRILVTTDFSDESRKAFRYAVAFAEQRLVNWIAREVASTVQATGLMREGRAFLEIVPVAQERGSDLIVISTHGYGGLMHVFMGSTAERVVRHASCPVLVVRQRGHDFLAGSKAKTATRKMGVKGKHHGY